MVLDCSRWFRIVHDGSTIAELLYIYNVIVFYKVAQLDLTKKKTS